MAAAHTYTFVHVCTASPTRMRSQQEQVYNSVKLQTVKVQVQVYIRELQNDQTATVNGAKHKSAQRHSGNMLEDYTNNQVQVK